MVTCQAIVNTALRKLGKLGGGRGARTVDANDALESLKGLYRSLINSGAFGRLRDVSPTADYAAGENEIVYRNSDGAGVINITLPEMVRESLGTPAEYGSRWVPPDSVGEADVRPPRDCSVIIIADAFSGEQQEYLYDGTGKRWYLLSTLALSDPAPLSQRDQDGLAAALAMNIADEYGGDVMPATMRLAAGFRSSLTHRYGMPRREGYGVYF